MVFGFRDNYQYHKGLYRDSIGIMEKENGNYYVMILAEGSRVVVRIMGPFLVIDYVTASSIWGGTKLGP